MDRSGDRVLTKRLVFLGWLGAIAVTASALSIPSAASSAPIAYVGLACVGSALLVWQARRMAAGRGAWTLLALGAVTLLAGQVALVAVSGLDRAATGVSPSAFHDHTGIALGGLVGYLLLYASQMALLRQRVTALLPSAWLDGLLGIVLLLAAALAFAAPFLEMRLNLGTTGANALVARPALDLLMVTFAFVNWSLSGWRSDPRLPLVLLSLSALLVVDVLDVLRLLDLVHVVALDIAANAVRLFPMAILFAAVSLHVTPPERRVLVKTSPLIAPVLVLVCSGLLILLDATRDLGAALTHLSLVAIAGVGVKFVLLHREVLRLADHRHLSLTDDLTGIANRRGLRAALDGVAVRSGPISLIVVDLDRFKAVNDRFGHVVGDELLCHTAAQLREVIPPAATVARTGGDEFTVVLPGVDESEVAIIAAVVVAALAEPVLLSDHPLRPSACAGAATAVEGLKVAIDAAELVRRADVALYLAKAAGGGSALYDESVDAASTEEARLLEELRVALQPTSTPVLDSRSASSDQIHVHYQPQVCASTDEVVGVEALVRWQHPRLGLLGPDAFLDLVERHNLMEAVTARVLWSAVPQVMAWRRDGHGVRLAVNVSASCLANPAFQDLLDEVLVTTGLEPAALVVEITETTLMADPEAALRSSKHITARGVGMSIDDYGTGYSSMAYINDLPVTELKLDRVFTARLLRDERTAAITATAIDLAHRLGMRLIAEGVEDIETQAALRELGCDETQGYLHSRPLPADELTLWLTRRSPTLTAASRITRLVGGDPSAPRLVGRS